MAIPQPKPEPLPDAREATKPVATEPVRRISSEQLLGGAVEVQIEHHGALYRLRHTALGKLILTK